MTPKQTLGSAAAIVTAIAAIVGAYHAATSWVDSRLAQFIPRAEASDYHQRASIAQTLQYHETMVEIAELELAALEAEADVDEDGEPSPALQRAIDRALDKIEFHENQMRAAREKLAADDSE